MSSLIKTVRVSEISRSLPRSAGAGAEKTKPMPASSERTGRDTSGSLAPHAAREAAAPVQPISRPTPDPAAAMAEELAKRRRESEQEGYRAGLQRAKSESAQLREAHTQRFEALMQTFEAERNRYVGRLDDGVPEIVIEAMVRLLGKTLAAPEGVVSMVREVIQRHCASQAKLVVRLAPSDIEFIGGTGVEAIGAGWRNSITAEPDDRVQVGGCLIDTPAGTLDARLEVQLERLKQAILDARRAPEPSEPHASV